jgi:hypothetical protein
VSPYGFGPDEGGLPGIEDLTGPARDPEAADRELRRAIGEDVPPRQRDPGMPDVSGLRGQLGEEFA